MSSFFGLVPILAVVVTIQVLLRNVSSMNITNEYLHHECINSQGKYQKGSQFEDNINRVVRLLSSGNLRDGFGDASHGEGPNNVFVRLQCRADSYWSKCHPCLATAISGLLRRCPGSKGAIIWYDQCSLRISTIHGYGKVDVTNKFYLSNPNKVRGDPQMFNKETSAFLEKLANKAADTKNVDGDSLVLYAAGDKMIGTNKVYALVQCTKDLVFKSCFERLKLILKDFSKCCDGKIGGRVLSSSCNFRYELYPFLRT